MFDTHVITDFGAILTVYWKYYNNLNNQSNYEARRIMDQEKYLPYQYSMSVFVVKSILKSQSDKPKVTHKFCVLPMISMLTMTC